MSLRSKTRYLPCQGMKIRVRAMMGTTVLGPVRGCTFKKRHTFSGKLPMSCLYRDLQTRVAHTLEVMLVTLFDAVPYTFLYVGDACMVQSPLSTVTGHG